MSINDSHCISPIKQMRAKEGDFSNSLPLTCRKGFQFSAPQDVAEGIVRSIDQPHRITDSARQHGSVEDFNKA